MDVELLEIRDFLSGVPPFDELPADALDRLPHSLSIRYLRRGSPFPPSGAGGKFLYVVRQGAIELRSARDEMLAKYGEGDVHAPACGDEPGASDVVGWAVEDTLVYLVPCRVVAELRAAHPGFDQHFSRSLRDRLRRSLDALQSSPALGGGLVRHQSATTVHLVSAVRRGASVAELVHAVARLPEMQVQLAAAGATPRHLGQAVGAVVDALTRRLIEVAEAELGPPPCPYAWLAFGSQARHEQTVLSDQDNGLLLADGADGHDAFFERLARFVVDGLHACGFTRCPGEVMASNPLWRQPLRGWRDHFDRWIERPEPKALMHTSIFFDLRAAAGDEELALALRSHVLGRLRGDEPFLAHLTANALGHAPPLGFFRSFVLVRGGEHAHTLDLKHGGVMPIVELARIHALVAGSAALGTVERLRDAAARGTLSRHGAEDLEDAFALVSTLRARHQAGQLKHGLAPDNHVRPDELSALERHHLKDAFAVIRRHQEALAQVYRARSFV